MKQLQIKVALHTWHIVLESPPSGIIRCAQGYSSLECVLLGTSPPQLPTLRLALFFACSARRDDI